MSIQIGSIVNFHADGAGFRAIIVGKREGSCQWNIRPLDYRMNNGNDTWAFTEELELQAMTEHDVVALTADHIRRVGNYMAKAAASIATRAVNHDASKWSAAEWPSFARVTQRLAGLTYGSPEYKASLKEIKPAIDRHYEGNSHHPEHYKDNGIDGMSLFDLIEMLCDWKAAGERHADGSIEMSLGHNRERFNISPQLHSILENTAKEMGWIA